MKLLTKRLFLLYLLFTSLAAQSQGEGNIWYFGQNAGIDFNSGTAVAIADGQIVTFEGCATISDNLGNLLFYTDGSLIYNANHQVMPNGSGLLGNSSSSQSAIIVPKPGSSNVYVVFTVKEQAGVEGLNYSEVDMTLQGGLGDVNAVYNTQVYTPTCEKIVAIKHQNNVDFWIVSHEYESNIFRSYLLNAAGLAATPVVSSIGMNIPLTVTGTSTIGYLKANADGDRIAMANTYLDTTQVFDFDNATGVLTNPITLPVEFGYGVEFSPSSQFLYLTDDSDILQFDLLAGSEINIVNSAIIVGAVGSNLAGALQLAPDGQIYCASGEVALSTISAPDLLGLSCNFQQNSFPLSAGTAALYGLPTFHNQIITSQTNFSICQGDSLYLYNPSFQNYNWALANTPSNVFSTDSSITVAPSTSTDYILFDGNDTSFFNITVSPAIAVDLGPDIESCDQNDIILVDLINSGNSSLTFLWQDGSANDSLVTSLIGTYHLTVFSGACTASDTMEIIASPGVNISSNNPICPGTLTGSIIINVPGSTSNFTFIIEDSNGNQVNTAGTNVANNLVAGWYQVSYTNIDGCQGVSMVELIDPAVIQFNLLTTHPLCYGDATGTVDVVNIHSFQGNVDSISYIWTPNPQQNNGLFTDSLFNLLAGEYTLEVVDDFGCVNSQIFYIQNPKPLEAIITDIKPTYCRTTATQSGNGVLAAVVPDLTNGTPPFTFEWLSLADGRTSNFSTVVMSAPGQIVLTITDANNCVYADTVLLDSINPIADFIIESDEFLFPTEYEGTELLSVKITNQSINFAQADNPLSDTIFQWNLFHNELPTSNQNWFFSYDLNEKVDTTYEGEQIYEVCLIAKNYNDCVDTTCKNVIVHAYPVLETPNVFTPGAYPNNTFFFPSAGIDEFECTVFNRYGIKVFEFNSITQEWDGNHYKSAKPCSEGVYFYVYNAMSTNGTPFTGEGQVTLIRAKK